MKIQKKILIICISVFLFLTAGYFGIAMFYAEGFTFGTYINGRYCTGKSVEQVNQELVERTGPMWLTIYYQDGIHEVNIVPKNMFDYDYTEELTKIADSQNPFLWYQNVFRKQGEGLTGYTVSPSVSVHQDKADKFFETFAMFEMEENRRKDVTFYWDEETGYCFENRKQNVLDIEKAEEVCLNALIDNVVSETMVEVYLEESSCYYDAELTAEEKEQLALYEKLQNFLDFEIIYQMGKDQVVFDKKALGNMLKTDGGRMDFVFDETGSFMWDEVKVTQAVETIADNFDTYGKEHTFQATSGKVITLDKGTYGNTLDQEVEIEYLTQALENRVSEVHEPAYERKAWCQDKNDIGDTYIEVDMGNQKLYFYKDGKVIADTDIVTGDMRRRRSTPEGVYYIYLKQKNRILRGPGYASHVNFWMPVKGGVGIHDAKWRDEFGGEIYETDGSHGCINVPYDEMVNIYEQAEVGMPVVMFY